MAASNELLYEEFVEAGSWLPSVIGLLLFSSTAMMAFISTALLSSSCDDEESKMYRGHILYQNIRPNKVVEALRWLKENNVNYDNVSLNELFQTSIPSDDTVTALVGADFNDDTQHTADMSDKESVCNDASENESSENNFEMNN